MAIQRKETVFFNHQDIWKKFREQHDGIIDSIKERPLEEWSHKWPGENIEKIIKAREEDWKSKILPKMKGNLGRTLRELEDKNEQNSPSELLQRAETTLKSIDSTVDTFNESLLYRINDINKLLWEFKKSIKKKAKNK